MSSRRTTSLSPPERFLLEQWGRTIHDAFGHYPYLVGSVARDEPWRDVDVRLILDDVEFSMLTNARRKVVLVLNVALSLWGQKATGLPIDFQFQPMTEANGAEHAKQPRVPLGFSDPEPTP